MSAYSPGACASIGYGYLRYGRKQGPKLWASRGGAPLAAGAVLQGLGLVGFSQMFPRLQIPVTMGAAAGDEVSGGAAGGAAGGVAGAAAGVSSSGGGSSGGGGMACALDAEQEGGWAGAEGAPPAAPSPERALSGDAMLLDATAEPLSPPSSLSGGEDGDGDEDGVTSLTTGDPLCLG